MSTFDTDLQSQAEQILKQIPRAYVMLRVAVTAPRSSRGSSRSASGIRSYVPLNTDADEYSEALAMYVFKLHRYVSESFGEPAPTVSLQMSCEDLIRWAPFWTRLPDAARLVTLLQRRLDTAHHVSGNSTREKLNAVCPRCLKIGGMFRIDDNYHCENCSVDWTPEQYHDAVKIAIEENHAA